MKTALKALIGVFIGVFMFASQASDDKSNQALIDRIKPAGQVKVSGAVEQSAEAGPRSGADVYQASCFACHASGVLDAPKKGDAAAWGPRLEQGMDTLLDHALNGINQMPPRGTCGNCSDDEIKAAIEYMVEGL